MSCKTKHEAEAKHPPWLDDFCEACMYEWSERVGQRALNRIYELLKTEDGNVMTLGRVAVAHAIASNALYLIASDGRDAEGALYEADRKLAAKLPPFGAAMPDLTKRVASSDDQIKRRPRRAK